MKAAATALALVAGLLAGCSEGAVSERLPDVRLPTLSARESPSLSSCQTAKCLTIYLAPWCSYCRQSTSMLLALRRFLDSRGVETRVVVGKDALAALRDYAGEFGPDTLLDVHDVLSVRGVPHFFVTDAKGAVLKEVSGVPAGDYSVEEVAGLFGLP